jgi:hypothetical protein
MQLYHWTMVNECAVWPESDWHRYVVVVVVCVRACLSPSRLPLYLVTIPLLIVTPSLQIKIHPLTPKNTPNNKVGTLLTREFPRS